MNVKPPAIAKDLYLDLRDRRLLPVVILLLVVLVAIPFVLGGGGEQPPPRADAGVGSAAANDAESVAQLTPFVTNEVPGIREFDDRLDSFKRRNPFRQQLTGPPKGAREAIEGLQQATQRLEEVESGGGSASVSASDSGDSSSGSTGSSGSGGGSGGSGGGSGGSEEIIVFNWKIDVKVGPVGDAKKVEGVKSLQFLPGRQRPIAQFIRGDFDESEAVFVISRNVDSTSGEGRCAPNRRNCQFLLLKVGEEHRFEYGLDGRTYRLKLTRVKLTEKRYEPGELSAEQLFKRSSGYGDLVETIRGS